MQNPVVLSDYLQPDEIDDLIEHVLSLAEMDTTADIPTGVHDDDMDNLIVAARRIRDREGFSVTGGTEK